MIKDTTLFAKNIKNIIFWEGLPGFLEICTFHSESVKRRLHV